MTDPVSGLIILFVLDSRIFPSILSPLYPFYSFYLEG